jgi:hypothetical protein
VVLSLESGRSRGDAINHEAVLAVLPDSREEAKSTKEIADAMELEISSYVDWVRTELRSVRALGGSDEMGLSCLR